MITRDQLKEYVETGREIEFKYNGKDYSITYYPRDKEKNYISFCEFYKETTEVSNVDDLLDIKRDGVTVREMLETITEDDVWIL